MTSKMHTDPDEAAELEAQALDERDAEQARADEALEGEIVEPVGPEAQREAHLVLAGVADALSDGIDADELRAAAVNLRPVLVDSVRERVRLVRTDRGAVVTDADVFPLVRQLTAAEETLRQVGGAWLAAADECVAIAGEELLTVKGEQDGIPAGRLIVPDGTGHEIVVQAMTRRAPDTYDVSGIVGVVGDQAARTVDLPEPTASLDDGERLTFTEAEVRAHSAAAAREAAAFVLTLLSSPKWASTKLDAFARALAQAGHDADAGVLQQARIKGAESWDGKTKVVREEAKSRRRG